MVLNACFYSEDLRTPPLNLRKKEKQERKKGRKKERKKERKIKEKKKRKKDNKPKCLTHWVTGIDLGPTKHRLRLCSSNVQLQSHGRFSNIELHSHVSVINNQPAAQLVLIYMKQYWSIKRWTIKPRIRWNECWETTLPAHVTLLVA